MKLADLPRSVRRSSRRSPLALAAVLLTAVAVVGAFFSHASVAHADGPICPTPPCVAGPTYRIVNQNSNLLLNVQGGSIDPGAFAIQGPDLNQKWTLVPTFDSDGSYYLQSINGGRYLDVYQASTTAGWPVDQWVLNGQANQKWILQPAPSGYYIKSVNSGLYLDVYNASTYPGASIIQWSFNGHANQIWDLEY